MANGQQVAEENFKAFTAWVTTRRNKNIAAVALANKNARTIWALLAHDREFRADYAVAWRHPPHPAAIPAKTGDSHRRLLRRSAS